MDPLVISGAMLALGTGMIILACVLAMINELNRFEGCL